METEENIELPAAGEQDRREDPRLPVDEDATMLQLSNGLRTACRLAEISLTGCRLRTLNRYFGETGTRVEASFKLRGLALRFSAVIEWTDRKNEVGIRFTDVTSRRRDELVEVLCEVAAENAAKAVKEAAERAAAEEAGQLPVEPVAAEPVAAPPPKPQFPAPKPLQSAANFRPPEPRKLPELATRKTAPLNTDASAATPAGTSAPLSAAQPKPAPARPAPRERRNQSRHDVDTSAVLHLVNVGSRLGGRILNLSMGGCRIRTDERFPVGIYTRVETEFHLEGLPFRLGGVVQAIVDRHQVGIRFLDMSERKREQVAQLIEEIEEQREMQAPTQEAPQGQAVSP